MGLVLGASAGGQVIESRRELPKSQRLPVQTRLPYPRKGLSDFSTADDQLMKCLRVKFQHRNYDVTDGAPADAQHAFVSNGKGSPGSVSHRQWQVRLVQRSKVVGKDGLLFKFLRSGRGRVVHSGKLQQCCRHN